jgi:NAD(P)-dependent dehydrogenase (short-subunit alcohol dehydrogenase family)
MAVSDGIKLNGLVHCAGIVPLTPIASLKREKIEQCFAINFYALIELIRCFTKYRKYYSGTCV